MREKNVTEQPNPPENSTERDRETLAGPPRWVKASAITAGVLLLITIAVMLLSGGEHGPARHGFGMGAPPSSVAAVQSHGSDQV
jgi:hypothetical protein